MLLDVGRAVHYIHHHGSHRFLDGDDVGEGAVLVGHPIRGHGITSGSSALELLRHIGALPLKRIIQQFTSKLLAIGGAVGGTGKPSKA